MTPSPPVPAPTAQPEAEARRRPTWLRTALGLVTAGAAAPVIVLLVLLLTAVIGGLAEGGLPRADVQAFNAFVFFAIAALYFGAPISIAVTILVGAPGVWLARRLDATSAGAFALGGAGAGCAALVGLGIMTSAGLDWEWFSWGPIFLVSGTISALVYWAIAERPFRADRRSGPAATPLPGPDREPQGP